MKSGDTPSRCPLARARGDIAIGRRACGQWSALFLVQVRLCLRLEPALELERGDGAELS